MTREYQQPTSAGVCSTCGKTVGKRYGGEGRYLPECIDCWTTSDQQIAICTSDPACQAAADEHNPDCPIEKELIAELGF